MKTSIVPIGDSIGIKIPRTILEQCHIKKNVIMEVEFDKIIIKPIKNKPRENWKWSFKKMHENEDDQLIIEDNIHLIGESTKKYKE